MTTTTTTQITCGRCSGKGFFSCYRSIKDGMCFACHGAGVVTVSIAYLKRQKRMEAQRIADEKRRANSGANAQLWEEFAAQHPEVAKKIWAGKDTDRVLGTAYSAVATYDRRDSNPEQALRLASM